MKTVAMNAAVAAVSLAAPADAAVSRRVVIDSGGERLVGDLFLPNAYRDGQRLPALVVTGAWTTVKEQMPARYAAELGDRGFAALTFDFRGWGQSEGSPRQLEDPARKTADIVAAAAYLATRPEVDGQRIGGLGICASSGYMAAASAQSPHIRALALVAPWLHDSAIVREVYGGEEGVQQRIRTSREAAAEFERTGQARMVPAASLTDDQAIMFQVPYYTERDRGMIPEWVNQFNLASWEPWLTYDAVAIAPSIGSKPLLMVHSEAAAVPQGARRFYGRLTGPRSELWLDNVTQLDFYDRVEPVTRASDAVAEHFRRSL